MSVRASTERERATAVGAREPWTAPGGWLRLTAALLASLAFNAALFSFLPMLGYWRQHGAQGPADRARETRLVALPMMPQKRELQALLGPT